MNAIINYLKETKGELKHVSWLTRQQVVAFTTVVIILSLGVALLLSLFDTLFSWLLKLVLN